MPLYKTGDSKDCRNYRRITLTSVAGKLYAMILQNRLSAQIQYTMEDTQSGFRKNRGTQDHIFTIRQICGKAMTGKDIHMCFVDMEKTFDRIKREDVWRILKNRGV